ncbi:uncharacterized protein LOC133784980 [Humulus lupulus]|uniref:uncharacterized protein LOC133784980 n=1 Tax=Humulus lupulus TaxID=3486 RepID=UPI002B401576|nr:uncharacterized protein LOC133784980 [Humulus lupulus]
MALAHGETQMLAYDVKKLWVVWNLRICVILSLFLQTFLILVGSIRKRYKSNYMHLLIWCAYYLADWIAAYALGQIVQTMGGEIFDPNKNGGIYLFWGQFVLLHLSGPDNIISFSPEDNGFWLKQLFGLLFQVVATIYSFSLLALAENNELWIPTILVFIAGLIKCYERVNALLNSTFDRFGGDTLLMPKPNPGRDYEYASVVHDPISERIILREAAAQLENSNKPPHGATMPISYNNPSDLGELQLLQLAYSFFKEFKVLFSGSFLSPENRESSRSYFLACDNYHKAFRLAEYELCFLHDRIHTKVVVLQNKLGYILRFICFCSVLIANLLFFTVEKQEYAEFDVNLTRALLMGTIFLDIISLIQLVFTEWNIAYMHFRKKLPKRVTQRIPSFVLKRNHWAESVFQCRMLEYCMHTCPTRLVYRLAGFVFGSTGVVDEMRLWFSPSMKVTADLKEFIFSELKEKSFRTPNLGEAIEACKDRGLSPIYADFVLFVKFEWSIIEFHYLESLLLWHIATDLCCECCEDVNNKYKSHCQALSNYMFYQLALQPRVLFQDQGNWAVVFQDTQEEAYSFFKKYSISFHRGACQRLMSVKTKYRAAFLKGPKSKSLLFDACILAKQLRSLGECRWELMAQVWVELMCFAAMNCSPTTHAIQPSKGGELLTFTWLLMYHLGLGTQFSNPSKVRLPSFL